MWILAFIGAGLVTAVIQLAIEGFPGDIADISRVLLLHQFAVTHGILAVLGFYINVIIPDKTAAQLKWPSGPFQVKYGFAQLGLGVMGVMSIWFTGNFWVGTLVTLYIYGLSGLWTHTQEVLKKRKETGRTDKVEVANIILDVVYHLALTWLSLQIPGVWSLS